MVSSKGKILSQFNEICLDFKFDHRLGIPDFLITSKKVQDLIIKFIGCILRNRGISLKRGHCSFVEMIPAKTAKMYFWPYWRHQIIRMINYEQNLSYFLYL